MSQDLEQALQDVEAAAGEARQRGEQVVRAIRKAEAAAKLGDIAALERARNEARGAFASLEGSARTFEQSWTFDVAAHVDSGGLLAEIRNAARAAGLAVHEQDGRIFSYPVLLRLNSGANPGDNVAVLDRKRSKAIRPSHIVAQLRKLRDTPPKFNARQFLRALHAAYQKVPAVVGEKDRARGPLVELIEIYDLLTLLPGQRSEYSRQEFTRDIYLLDRTGALEFGFGSDTVEAELTLSSTSSRGSKRQLLETLDQDGTEKVYYAIKFSRRKKQ